MFSARVSKIIYRVYFVGCWFHLGSNTGSMYADIIKEPKDHVSAITRLVACLLCMGMLALIEDLKHLEER